MSTMTERMSEASGEIPVDEGGDSPKKGERFHCAKCGMEVQVTADCGGQELLKV